MKLTKKISIGAIATLIATGSILFTQPLNSNAQAANTTSNTIVLTHNSYVYNDQGKRKKTYRGLKKPVLTVGARFEYSGGKTFNINGKKYYSLGYIRNEDGYIKAANAKPTTNQGQSNTLWLNHNAYIYNKNGQRLKNYRGKRKLYWGHSVKYIGEVQPTTVDSKQYYLLNDDNYHQSWLPYRTIKGNQYYNLGKGGYIKATNVGKIADQPLYRSEATVTLKARFPNLKEIPVSGSHKVFKNGEKVTVDGITGMYNITPDNYYRIKGTDNAFIDGIYITNKPRQKMKLYTTYTYVHPLHDTDTYNISGENWNNILPQNTPALLKENNIPVDEALYIWVLSENKAELFYHLATPSLTFQQQGIKPDVYKDKNYNYVKASDVKYISGPILKPENTIEEAKSDIAIANTQDKQTLQKIIDQEKSIKASKNYIKYYDEANNYNNALKNAKEVNASEKSTIAEVNETTRLLNKAIKNLNEPLVNADSFPIIQPTFQ